jgi:YidC/Oxa1 family membrane protein insertase
LSAKDPLTPVNLFGALHFTPPAMMAIGVLPILVAFTIWLQQKFNPQMPDPVQRQIFALMPWFLMVVMAPFAAGLQIYWLTNNLLSILQQRILYARHPVLKQAMQQDIPPRLTPNPAPSPAPSPPPPPPSPPPSSRRGKQRPRTR